METEKKLIQITEIKDRIKRQIMLHYLLTGDDTVINFLLIRL
jgi:hypothetical protein